MKLRAPRSTLMPAVSNARLIAVGFVNRKLLGATAPSINSTPSFAFSTRWRSSPDSETMVRAKSHPDRYANRTAWKKGFSVHAESENLRSPCLSPFFSAIQSVSTVEGMEARPAPRLAPALRTRPGLLAARRTAALSESPMPAVSGPITFHSGARLSAAY